jgi:hypothetical protein
MYAWMILITYKPLCNIRWINECKRSPATALLGLPLLALRLLLQRHLLLLLLTRRHVPSLLLTPLYTVGLNTPIITAYDYALISLVFIILTIFSAIVLNSSSTLYPLCAEVS